MHIHTRIHICKHVHMQYTSVCVHVGVQCEEILHSIVAFVTSTQVRVQALSGYMYYTCARVRLHQAVYERRATVRAYVSVYASMYAFMPLAIFNRCGERGRFHCSNLAGLCQTCSGSSQYLTFWGSGMPARGCLGVHLQSRAHIVSRCHGLFVPLSVG